VTGIIGYAIDITARKLADEMQAKLLAEVQHVNEELQQFAYIVSHDLNEPLRAITNFITLLAKRYRGKLDAEADEYITFVTDGAHRLQQMLTALLAYTRVGRATTAATSVDCGTLLAHVLDDLRLAITDSQAVITYDPLPTIQGDATRLKQVLQNLISNAIKFRGPAPPQIHITARRTDAQWQFSVRDNGIGIDLTQAGRLFQVFQRLHPQGGYQGTGIGLAICKRIVEQYGGRIWVESELGKGTTFFFTLPATVSLDSPGNAVPAKKELQEA
jgi:light-regulated signal transduction histidine kinase (bacteriophytochrome)